MSRSFLAVLAGVAASYALTLTSDSAFGMIAVPDGDDRRTLVLVCAILAHFASIGFAGWLTGVLARQSEVAHAGVMGLVRLLISLAIAVEIHGDAPTWWIVTRLLLVVPAAMLGGALRAFQRLPQET